MPMQGEHAHRVWNLIYSQSCFSGIADPDVCAERKVFYRLISGMIWVAALCRLCLHAAPVTWVMQLPWSSHLLDLAYFAKASLEAVVQSMAERAELGVGHVCTHRERTQKARCLHWSISRTSAWMPNTD